MIKICFYYVDTVFIRKNSFYLWHEAMISNTARNEWWSLFVNMARDSQEENSSKLVNSWILDNTYYTVLKEFVDKGEVSFSRDMVQGKYLCRYGVLTQL